MNTKLKTLPLALLIVAASAFAVTGCGEKTDDAKDSAADTPAVSITEPWARVTTPKQDTGAAYMTLASENGDKLTKVEVPSNIADHAELHEVKMAMDGSDKMQDGGKGQGIGQRERMPEPPRQRDRLAAGLLCLVGKAEEPLYPGEIGGAGYAGILAELGDMVVVLRLLVEAPRAFEVFSTFELG